jgi:Cu-Zn family superoxide dismutase
MRLPLIVAGLVSLPLVAFAQSSTTSHSPEMHAQMHAQHAAPRAAVGATAQAPLSNGEGASTGTATFRQGPTGVLIRIEATGLTPGWHGLHLHAVGQCEGPGFQSAGAHVQHGAEAKPHGLLNVDGDDAGDLPNLYADAAGNAFAEVFTTTAALIEGGPGEYLLDADGSSIMIHAQADDHVSQPIGGSGARVACGVIAAQ